MGLERALGAAWRAGLGQGGAGAYWQVELGETGAVHMHVLYLGPFVNKAWLEKILQKAYDRCGFAFIREVCDADATLAEIVKYTTKTGSPLCESWITHGRVVMHPTLVARWELATTSLRLHGYRGVLRTVKPAEVPAAPENPGEGDGRSRPTECERCGSTELEEVNVDLLEYVRLQHARGVAALRGSRAPPPRPSADPSPPIVAPAPAPWSPNDVTIAYTATPTASPEWTEEWVA